MALLMARDSTGLLLTHNIIHEEHAETGKPFVIYRTTS
jgi:hypothetical protein